METISVWCMERAGGGGEGVGGCLCAHAPSLFRLQVSVQCAHGLVFTRLEQVRLRARLSVGRGLICWWEGREPQCLCADCNALWEIIKVNWESAAGQNCRLGLTHSEAHGSSRSSPVVKPGLKYCSQLPIGQRRLFFTFI